MRRAAYIALLLVAACSGPPSTTQLTVAQLQDPASCQACHPTQFSDWQGSMHAYASEDPVFLAMNARGQRETDGGLGSFCIQCHAPMAVQTGASTDGLNLTTLPAPLHGVTCFFCHTVAEVNGAHDDPLLLAFDGGLRGSIQPPEPALISGMPHGGVYSPYLDSANVNSATMCGACHDIVNGHGTAIERTFAEWQASAFSKDTTGGETCNQCHMLRSNSLGPISTLPGSPPRELHAHTFAAIDTALVQFPDQPAQAQDVQQFLDTSLASAVCVDPTLGGYQIQIYLDNISAGHQWPSGADQDRRAWIEVVAQGADGGVVYQSGVVPQGSAPTDTGDPDMWLLRDCMFAQDGTTEVHMFWEAYGYEGNELPSTVTFDATNPLFYNSHVVQTYPRQGALLGAMPAQVTLQVYLQPIGLDVLNDLVASGDLDAGFPATMPTYAVGPPLTWTLAAAQGPSIGSSFADPNSHQLAQCVSYQGYNTASNIYTTAAKAVAKANCSP